MLIVGAKGFAKEVLETVFTENKEEIVFYDDINNDNEPFVFSKFKILQTAEAAKDFFATKSPDYTIGVGNPFLRLKLFEKFNKLGGIIKSTISIKAVLGQCDISIGPGCNILANAILSNSTTIGKCCIIYYNVTITHDCKIGNFVELSPGATLLGRCRIGDFARIGANATILPDIGIGKNVVIGAGAVVNRDIPDNAVAVGVPARVIKVIK